MVEGIAFQGFKPPRSNATYTPNQFFDVVLRHGSRGVVRLVAYLIRQTLGWCDADGNPREAQITVSYRELEQRAGVGHSMIGEAVREAIEARFIEQVRAGRPDRKDSPAQTASYRLRWDTGTRYLTDPALFQGFYAGNGNLTYIPDQFFDDLVPRLPLAELRVIGAVIRHTIGFQTRYGFRRQHVRLSFSDLQRITRLNRDTVRLALNQVLVQGFLVRIEPGCFDKAGGRASRAAVYGVHWEDSFEQRSDSTVTPLRKPARSHSGNPSGERSENPSGGERSPNNTLEKQQPADPAPEPVVAVAAAVFQAIQPGYERLVAMGFDRPTARQMATAFDNERIQRQCDWLPKRHPRSNTLGLLRRAIEEDWPEPKADPLDTPAARFAASFYAGWSGVTGPATARPSGNDLDAAAAYAERLPATDPDTLAGWGREFGAYARRSEPRRDAPCSLVYALRLYGDGFLELLAERQRKAERLTLVAAQRAHQQQHQAAYLDYLRERERRLQQEAPEAYARFAEHEASQRRFLERSKLSAASVAQFEREEQRLTRLHLFFAGDAQWPVLEFWGWDDKHNPAPFERAVLGRRQRVVG